MAGRKKIEGTRHMYTVADDVNSYIMSKGGGKYINDIIRAIIAAESLQIRKE